VGRWGEGARRESIRQLQGTAQQPEQAVQQEKPAPQYIERK